MNVSFIPTSGLRIAKFLIIGIFTIKNKNPGNFGSNHSGFRKV
jgi:hypothetical protein